MLLAGVLLGVLMLVGNSGPAAADPFANAWTGTGSVTAGSPPVVPTVPVSGTNTVVDSGLSGPARFTYDFVNPGNNGITGTWTFQTTAPAADLPTALAYTYSGFHSFFIVTANLKLFVEHGGVRTETTLVTAGPTNCCTAPSSSFCYSGHTPISVQPGDTYGYTMTGSNFDSNSTLRGSLVVTPGTTPIACPVTDTTTTTTTTIDPTPPAGVSATIVQAVESSTGTVVRARVTGTPSAAYNVNVLGAQTCVGGQLVSPTKVGAFPVTVDSTGASYGEVSISSTAPFLALTASIGNGTATAASTCAARGADNDVWTRALEIGLTGGIPLTGSSTGRVDSAGGARWYRFAVQPGSKVRVDLSNLPADFDLALFRDINQTFKTLTTTSDLTRLSAEFAPSVFSPSVFSPSVFSPSVFSPDAYAPSVFSPSVFSPSVFSPSVFSPSVFSPSVFSPSVFSPSVFSPSVFSPSVFSPSVFSPSVFSPAGVAPSVFSAESFVSAQTRSLIGVSSTAGTANESIVADTWNNTGYFYVRVSGRNGAFSADSPFTVSVTRNDLPACSGVNPIPGAAGAGGSGFQTVVLYDSSRLPTTSPATRTAELDTLKERLTTFAARPDVAAAVVDLAGDARIQALNAQADSHKGCPYAKNLVAAGIKDIVAAYRPANPNLRYVVLIGPDGTIPFFRYPDEGLLGPESDYVPPVGSDTSSEASLRLNYILGQDEYGSSITLPTGASTLPIPDLAVGRLVETASEATGMLDAYLTTATGAVTPTKSLVTGYDFLADAADAVAADLTAGGTAVDSLIAPNNISPQDSRAWTATDLRTKLLGSGRHDLVFLAGHFSANSALAADFATSALSTELAASNTDFVNSVVFSAGCHSGYNIDDADAIAGVTAPLDWAQAFSRKKATLIAGTGYQYGDTDFLEYSERIYAGFTRQLRYGSGPVSVGQALARAKQQYLNETPDARGIHRKALIESALFGLPMLSVNLPGGRGGSAPTDTSIIPSTTSATEPGATLRLRLADTTISSSLGAPVSVPLTVIGSGGGTRTAQYYRGPDGVVVNPAEPALPLVSKNVSVPGLVLRGIGFRGGNYSDNQLLPLTGAATTELRGVHSPFTSPVFFPMRIATANYLDALSSAAGSTRLMVTPVQHRSIPGSEQSTARVYSNVDVRLFYSDYLGASALAAAPSISGVAGSVVGNDVVFNASVTGDPRAGIQTVWVTYTGDASRWTSTDLAQCVIPTGQTALPVGCTTVDSTKWVGRIVGGAASAANLQFMVQAANGVGLVTLDDNLGAYHRVPVPVTVGVTPVAAPTSLQLEGAPSSAQFGTSTSVTAVLTSNGTPVSGRSVTIGLGSSGTPAVTDANGRATVTLSLNTVPGPSTVRASFDGVPGALLSSGASVPITIDKSPTQLAIVLTPPAGTAGPLGVRATLTDAQGGPLGGRTVYLVIAGATTTVVPLQTDYLGRASLSPLSLEPGSYTLTAQYLGNVPTIPGTASDPTYLPSSASTSTTVIAVADLTVTGSLAPTAPFTGTPATYTFTIVNNGPNAASGVTLSDVLPASLSTPTTGTTGCAIATGTLSCTFASLASGASQVVTVTGQPTVVGPLSNSATVAWNGSDPNLQNNTAVVNSVVSLPPSAPVSVPVTGPSTLVAGALYTAAASSQGNPAPTFSFAASPAKPSWLTINPTTGAISGQVPTTGVTSFSYKVTASNSVGNATSALITVTVTRAPDVRIDIVTAGLYLGLPGTYAIAVTNLGSIATVGPVTVTDVLPAGLNYRTFLAPGWACAVVSRTVTCTSNRPLPARSISAIAIVVDITAARGTSISNTVQVVPTDNVPANNTATVRATVIKL